MANVNLSFRIEGATDAQGRVQKFPSAALQSIREVARDRARQTVFRFKQEMAREYTSAWATGMLARGITFRTFVEGNGINIRFFIEDRRELRYVTAALGGHFKQFPVGPFEIRPHPGRKALVIPFPNSLARRFLRGAKGQLAGSRSGPIVVKQVLWGNRSGGFPRDVISEVAADEGVLFVRDMQAAVANAVVKVTS